MPAPKLHILAHPEGQGWCRVANEPHVYRSTQMVSPHNHISNSSWSEVWQG